MIPIISSLYYDEITIALHRPVLKFNVDTLSLWRPSDLLLPSHQRENEDGRILADTRLSYAEISETTQPWDVLGLPNRSLAFRAYCKQINNTAILNDFEWYERRVFQYRRSTWAALDEVKKRANCTTIFAR